MTTKGTPTRPRYAAWLGESLVALLGTVVVVLLLTLPIRTFGPGDHEEQSCGNALTLDLDRWRDTTDGDYWDGAFQDCTTQRIDRVAIAVGAVSVTVLILAVMAAWRRRRNSSDSPNS
jgi:hypothetical protein